MRKRTGIAALCVLALCLVWVLTTCSRGYISNKGRIIRDYTEHEELFRQCAAEIREQYGDLYDKSFQISVDENGLIFRINRTADAEWSAFKAVGESRLAELFHSTGVNLIYGRDRCIYFREFAAGMGSTTSAGICCVERGDIRYLPEYWGEMSFRACRGGYLGEMPEHDNYLFYQELAPSFFFYEYGD